MNASALQSDPHADPQAMERCVCVCGSERVLPRQVLGRDEVHGGLFTYVRCADCGTERVQPRPTAERIGHYYPNTYYAYTGPEAAPAPSMSDRVKRLVYELYWSGPDEARQLPGWLRPLLLPLMWPLRFRTNLAFRPGLRRRVFEMGAATGTDLLEFRAVGWDVAGCEPSEKACEVAQRRGIQLQHCPAEAAVLGEGAYDCVLINNVFEHLHDPRRVLQQVYRGLAPGGVVVIIVPNHASIGAKVFGAAWPGYDPPRHLWGFTPQSLARLLTETGFAPDYVAHKAPQRWCWDACVSGFRLPGGETPIRRVLSRFVPPLLVPLGALSAGLNRGEFFKIVARRPA